MMCYVCGLQVNVCVCFYLLYHVGIKTCSDNGQLTHCEDLAPNYGQKLVPMRLTVYFMVESWFCIFL